VAVEAADRQIERSQADGAMAKGWTVVDMKQDWKIICPAAKN